MDQHKALNALLESADLISMLEELANASSKNGFTTASIAGLRITLRNVREQILNSHDELAQTIIARAKSAEAITAPNRANQNLQSSTIAQQRETLIVGGRAGEMNVASRSSANSNESSVIQRKDLRAAIEKVMDNS